VIVKAMKATLSHHICVLILLLGSGCSLEHEGRKAESVAPSEGEASSGGVEYGPDGLTDEERARVRQETARVLSSLPADFEAYLTARPRPVNSPAWSAALLVGGPEASVAIASLLPRHQDPGARATILSALGQLREPGAAEDLIPLLDSELRQGALLALADEEVLAHADAITPLLAHDHVFTRLAAAARLSDVGIAAGDECLLRAVRSPDRYANMFFGATKLKRFGGVAARNFGTAATKAGEVLLAELALRAGLTLGAARLGTLLDDPENHEGVLSALWRHRDQEIPQETVEALIRNFGRHGADGSEIVAASIVAFMGDRRGLARLQALDNGYLSGARRAIGDVLGRGLAGHQDQWREVFATSMPDDELMREACMTDVAPEAERTLVAAALAYPGAAGFTTPRVDGTMVLLSDNQIAPIHMPGTVLRFVRGRDAAILGLNRVGCAVSARMKRSGRIACVRFEDVRSMESTRWDVWLRRASSPEATSPPQWEAIDCVVYPGK